jgi:nucleoside 2-deoxyribosyltransferase
MQEAVPQERPRPIVYLAGPDVFLPEAMAWAETRKEICLRHGLFGVTPFDPPSFMPSAWEALPEWQRIFLANESHIRRAAAVIANLTPFRGPSADPGTVYEVGLARGLGRPVFGYSTTMDGFTNRSHAVWGPTHRDANGVWRDRDGLSVEDFDLFDNLMIVGGLSVPLIAMDVPADRRWTDLAVFERCVIAAAQILIPVEAE